MIHSNSPSNQVLQVRKELLIQGRSKKALSKMDKTMSGDLVTIKADRVLKPGDMVFYSKNRAYQKWLMDHQHLWLKEVHIDLEPLPSTRLAHDIPKYFNPRSEL